MKYSVLLLATASFAHSTSLTSPAPRSNVESDSLTGPCGAPGKGPSQQRTTVTPSTNLALVLGHSGETLQVNVGLGSDPSNFPFSVASLEASSNIPLDWSSVKGVKNGDLATIQVIATGSDGSTYACADVIVSGLASGASATPTSVPASSERGIASIFFSLILPLSLSKQKISLKAFPIKTLFDPVTRLF
jgi:hypothetical protein